MEEKTLFRGTFEKNNKLAVGFLISGVFVFIIGLIITEFDLIALLELAFTGHAEALFVFGAIGCLIISVILYFMMRNCQIVITDKKIFGQAAFGKKISLPLSKISAVSMNTLRALSVSTSSGRITFWLITNGDEAWKIIDNIIIEREK